MNSLKSTLFFTNEVKTGCYSKEALRLAKILEVLSKPPLFQFICSLADDGEIVLKYDDVIMADEEKEALGNFKTIFSKAAIKDKLVYRNKNLFPTLEILLDKIEMSDREFLEKYGKRGEEFIGKPLGPFEIAQADAFKKALNDLSFEKNFYNNTFNMTSLKFDKYKRKLTEIYKKK